LALTLGIRLAFASFTFSVPKEILFHSIFNFLL